MIDLHKQAAVANKEITNRYNGLVRSLTREITDRVAQCVAEAKAEQEVLEREKREKMSNARIEKLFFIESQYERRKFDIAQRKYRQCAQLEEELRVRRESLEDAEREEHAQITVELEKNIARVKAELEAIEIGG